MSLKKDIIENIANKNLSDLCLLYILNESKYFKDNYEYLNLIKKNNDFIVFNNYLNNVKGLSNNELKKTKVSTNNQYNIDFELEEKDIYKDLIIKEKDRNRMELFQDILLTSKTISEIIESINKENKKDNLFISKIKYLLNENKSDNKLLFSLFFKEEKDIEYLKSYKNNEISNIVDSCYFEDNIFFGFSKIKNLSRIKLIKEITSDDFSIYKLKKILKSDKIVEVPDFNTSEEKILFITKNTVNGNLKDSIFNILISRNKNIDQKLIDLLFFKNFKEKTLNDIESILSNKSMEYYFELYKDSLNETYKKIKDKYPVLKDKPNLNDIKLEIIEKKEKNDLINVFESQDFNIYQEFEKDAAMRGLEFATYEGLTNEYFKEVFFVVKNQFEIIGFSKINNDPNKEHNVYNLATISVKKNFKNMGISKKILNAIADYCKEQEKILEISIYTKDGISFLPKTVEDIRKNKEVIILETDFKINKNEHLKDFESNFAKFAKISKINYKEQLKIYHKHINDYKNNKKEYNPSVDESYDVLLKDFNKIMKKNSKIKVKNN